MNQFYLLVATLFFIGVSGLSAETPEFLNSCEGITHEIKKVEDEILKRKAIIAFLENQADRWYFFKLVWWQDSLMNWKQVDKENEYVDLLRQEIVVLKKLLKSCASAESKKAKIAHQ